MIPQVHEGNVALLLFPWCSTWISICHVFSWTFTKIGSFCKGENTIYHIFSIMQPLKKGEVMSYAVTWRDYYTEWTQVGREGKISYDITYIWILMKMIPKNLFIKQKGTHRFQNQCYGYHRWNHCGEGRILRVGLTYTHYCIK